MPKPTAAAGRRAGRKRTDGVSAAAAETKPTSERKENKSKAVAEVKSRTRDVAGKRRPILSRKLDLLYLIFFVVHVPVMLGELIDLRSGISNDFSDCPAVFDC